MGNFADDNDREEMNDLLKKREATLKPFTVTLKEARKLVEAWAPDLKPDIKELSASSCIWCLNSDEDGVYDKNREFNENEEFICIMGENDDPEEPTFYHQECWLESMEDDDGIDITTMDYEFPRNVCMLCEQQFKKDLPFTDGAGYFCKECGEGSMRDLVYPVNEKIKEK